MPVVIRPIVAISVLALFASQSAPAPAPQPPQIQTLKAGSAIVVGKVVEAGTTTGVAAATVTLQSEALGLFATSRFSDGTPGGSRRIVTDQEGRFMFHGLPAGAYVVFSQAPGWVDGLYGQGARMRGSFTANRTLDLTDGDRTVPVTIQMSRRGGISGSVVDEAGDPLVNAPVSLLARIIEGGRVRLETTQTVMTDDRGMYHADDYPGEYVVAVIAATTTVPASAVDGFNLAQREGGPAFQAYMTQISRNGSLLPRGVGARVGDFLVSQYGQRNAWVVPPMTEQNGRAMFYPTTFHPSSPNASAGSTVTIGSGEEKAGIDIVMRSQPVRRVTGRVFGPDGAAMPGIAIRLIAPDMSASDAGQFPVNNDTPQTLSDGNGKFTFIGIAPGSYIARILRTAPPAEPIAWAADQINVAADTDATDLQIRLRGGARISGRIVVDPASPPLPTAAYGTIGVRAAAPPGTPGWLMAAIDWFTRPDETGRLTSGEYVPGPYTIRVFGLPKGWTVQSATVGGKDAIDRLFDLPATGVTDLVITIANRQSQVAGMVRDGNGQPAPQATVIAFPADRSLWPISGIPSRRAILIPPGRDGRYVVTGLPAGEYMLAASEAASFDLSDPQLLTSLGASATRISLGEAESRTLDLVARR